ncbi:MAG TPA: hypothetical protein VGM88_24975 [Kofleriaceae bacterium]
MRGNIARRLAEIARATGIARIARATGAARIARATGATRIGAARIGAARIAAVVAVVVAGTLAACAPAIDSPALAQRATDRDDAARIAQALAALPGVETAHVELHRVARDPLSPTGVAPPLLAPAEGGPAAQPSPTDVSRAAAVVTVDSDEARTRVETAAATLMATTGVASPTIVVQIGEPRVPLASVGPFTVAAGSRGPLRALLVGALLAIAALGAVVALRYRRGKSAQ